MSDLSDEIKEAWVLGKSTHPEGKMVLTNPDVELAPGFTAMREYYSERTVVQLRRSYRHFAGSSMPTTADELITLTMPIVSPKMVLLLAQVFTDGVMVGQAQDLQVKMALHFNNLEHLFELQMFRERSSTMAKGFLADTDVGEFLIDYVSQSMDMLSHYSGFAHTTEVDPAKIWDVWALMGSATTTSAYAAGYSLGRTWAERDTLDGIVIASGEGGTHGTEGEAGPGH